PQCREEPDPAEVAQRGGGRHGGVGRFGERRPAEDDHDRPLVTGFAADELGGRPQCGIRLGRGGRNGAGLGRVGGRRDRGRRGLSHHGFGGGGRGRLGRRRRGGGLRRRGGRRFGR